MQLIDLYAAWQREDITLDDFANSLNITPASLNRRLGHWGTRLALLLSTLDAYKARKITRVQAAQALGVSTRDINSLAESWDVKRDIPIYLVDKATIQIKWEIRRNAAIDFISGTLDLDKASAQAGVSPRQMRRWVSELLMKHLEMSWADLKDTKQAQRERLAKEIRIAEDLQDQRESLIRAVSGGKLLAQHLAIDRVIEKRA